MNRVPAAPFRLAGALLLGAVALFTSCKGSAQSSDGGWSAASSGNQNAIWSGPGGAGARQRTDHPPTLTVAELWSLRTVRIFESRDASGALLRFRELFQSDGTGNLRVDVLEVWDETSQAWILPHPLLEALYGMRTSYIARLRDLHLHARGLYANYRWEQMPGTVTVDGRACVTTRAHSLRNLGPIDLVHEVGTGLLLGWTVWDESGTQVMQSLTTLTVEMNPNQSSVQWVNDLLPEEPYNPLVHDALLGITPRALTYPPAGFYREKAVVEDLRAQVSPVNYVYLEYWTDGLRTLFVMQHAISNGNGGGGLNLAQMSHEGGIVAVESDASDRRIGAVGLLPKDDILMVVGDLHE